MIADPASRLTAQIQFILEADRLKDVQRRSDVISGGRRENSAEHSWHIALMSMVLAEYANASIDALKEALILMNRQDTKTPRKEIKRRQRAYYPREN